MPEWDSEPRAMDFGLLRVGGDADPELLRIGPELFDLGLDQPPAPSPAVEEPAIEHVAPSLSDTAPTWMLPLPQRIVTAAEKFETRHARRLDAASRLYSTLHRDTTSAERSKAFEYMTNQVRRNRFWALPPPTIVTRGTGKIWKKKAKQEDVVETAQVETEPPPWSLETSIWWPRASWCDSKSLFDTEECERRKLAAVMKRARAVGMQKFILDNDDDDDDDGVADDDDGDGIPDEVEQVEEVIWESHDLLFMLFDLYTAMGDDLSTMDYNEYAKLVKDFRLASVKLPFAKPSDLDTMFIAVDTASKRYNSQVEKGLQDKNEREKSLSIAEFVHVLTRIAVARYVKSGKETDVSAAVKKMMTEDIEPRANTAMLAENNIFRRAHCYNQPTDTVLRRHEASLRVLFNEIATTTNEKIGPLVMFATWSKLIQRLDLLDVDVSERDASFCFTASRMCVSSPYSARGHHTSMGLPFEGFLEGLVRVACLKALPTDDEIREAEMPDAGAYLTWLATADEQAYEELIESRGTAWGAEPPQPADRCLDHLLSIIVRVIEGKTSAQSNLVLSKKEVHVWWTTAAV